MACSEDDQQDASAVQEQEDGPGSITTLRQQVEARLDDIDTYTSGDLLKLCHVYILKRPPALVLVELGVMSSADRERYIVLDTQHSLLFWQGSTTYCLHKLNVRAQSSISRTLAHRCPPHLPPRTHVNLSAFFMIFNDNSIILAYCVIIVQCS